MSEGDDPHQPPAPLGIRESFNVGFQVSFFVTSFIIVALTALGVRIVRRLKRDRERNRNIIDADWSPVEPESDETDLTVR